MEMLDTQILAPSLPHTHTHGRTLQHVHAHLLFVTSWIEMRGKDYGIFAICDMLTNVENV